MVVRELVEKLKGLDQDLDVLCCSEDDDLLPPGLGLRLLEISDVAVRDGERLRGDDGIPTLKLGKGPNSVRIAMIDVT